MHFKIDVTYLAKVRGEYFSMQTHPLVTVFLIGSVSTAENY